MTIDTDLINIVDQRIRLHDKANALTGTVVSRATTGPSATVLFDGSTVAVPVKCMGHVFCQPSDRVALSRYGSDWLIVGSFSGPGFGESARQVFGLSGATGHLTSSAFVDLTEFGTFQFTKFYDNTVVRAGVTVGGFSSTAGQLADWAIRFTPISGGAGYTPADNFVVRQLFSVVNVHQSSYGATRIATLPSGTYTVSLRWKLAFQASSGYIVSDNNDYHFAECDERVRSSTPYL